MSLGYSSSSIIGGPLDQSVLDQIEARRKVLAKRNGRTTDNLLYLNSATGWVRLSSSIDTLVSIKDSSGNVTKETESTALAERNVLTGGIEYEGKQLGGIFNGEDTAYSKSDILGYRPMAGITGFQVDAKNQFGTLRVGTVNFKVNSLEQLDELEQLYLRPGFSILLEWGHSLYVRDDGTLERTPQYFGKDWWTGMSSDAIQEKIKELKEASDNNYDAIFGIIKNFVWSYNLDGGYDCKVDIVSQGEIIESIQAIIQPQPLPQSEDGKKIEDYDASKDTTPLHTFLNVLYYANSDPETGNQAVNRPNAIQDTDIPTALETFTPTLYRTLVTNLEAIGKEFSVLRWKYRSGDTEKDTTSHIRLIPISHFLMLINEIFLVKDERGNPVSKYYVGSDANKTPFVTFDQHFALDPTKVVLPKPTSTTSLNRMSYKISQQATTQGVEINDILNIYVSTELILGLFNGLIEKQEKPNIHFLVQAVLKEVNLQLGGINDLDITYDETDNLHYLVDRKITPLGDSVKLLDLVGLNSQVHNLSFASKLSSNVTSMMAISAQVRSSNVAMDTLAVQKWNSGLHDRHLGNKTVGLEDKSTQQDLESGDNLKPIDEVSLAKMVYYLDSVNSDLNANVLNYNPGNLAGFQTLHRVLMHDILKYATIEENINPSGLIPFELSFTLSGIGGMKIGQAIKIPNELIPKRYRDNVAFIITGVSHKIENNRWVTDIKTQMTIISKFEGKVEKLVLPSREDAKDLATTTNADAPASSTGLELYPFLGTRKMETRSDDKGSGVFNASRTGGRFHKGWDILVEPGNEVYAPITGIATWNAPYSKAQKVGKKDLGRIKITGTGEYKGIIVTIGYVTTPIDGIKGRAGKQVTFGQKIALAGSVRHSYIEPEMKDHLHVVIEKGDGNYVDPSLEKYKNLNIPSMYRYNTYGYTL